MPQKTHPKSVLIPNPTVGFRLNQYIWGGDESNELWRFAGIPQSEIPMFLERVPRSLKNSAIFELPLSLMNP